MLYEEGHPVAAGAVVATIDKRPFQDDVRQATAEVAAQAANPAKLEAGSRTEEIAQARATVAQRDASLAHAHPPPDRREQLLGTGAVSTRSEARRAGNGCDRTSRSRGSPEPKTKKKR